MTDLSPLFGLRLRTPRLELRLPTGPELAELREVARAGIHPPDEMPFAVAWTDEPYSESWVVAFLEEQLAAWKPEEWHLNLGVWADGELVGSQGMGAERFAATRAVATGSWLGRRFQGRGIGTEMRTAVLELAFRRLGYRQVGRSTVAPRGEDVGHADLDLRRDEWRAPFPVEIEGLEPCLPLFGLAP